MSNDTKISVLLPTRGRREVLVKSVLDLCAKAHNPRRLEILLGIDDDDTGIQEYIKDHLAQPLQDMGVECRASIFQPLGYARLHDYVNTLAAYSTGDWLFFWNDDGIMVTDGWDDVITQYDGQFKLLAPRDNHNGHPYAIFPIVPRDWYILMGHLSLNAQNDAWLSHLAYMLDIFERIDVEFIHDRADITGNNNDATFQNREYQEGNPEDPADFGHPDQQKRRVQSAHKIAWFLDRIGQRSEWWERVKAGEQDPFEKMVWQPGVRGAGQLDGVTPASEEDVTLTL